MANSLEHDVVRCNRLRRSDLVPRIALRAAPSESRDRSQPYAASVAPGMTNSNGLPAISGQGRYLLRVRLYHLIEGTLEGGLWMAGEGFATLAKAVQ